MNTPSTSWERRVSELWSAIDSHEPEAFVAAMQTLVAELPTENPIGLFEHAAAQDSTGHPDLAVPLYRAALAAGLEGIRRRRAVIQMSSSLRNLGNPALAAELLGESIAAEKNNFRHWQY